MRSPPLSWRCSVTRRHGRALLSRLRSLGTRRPSGAMRGRSRMAQKRAMSLFHPSIHPKRLCGLPLSARRRNSVTRSNLLKLLKAGTIAFTTLALLAFLYAHSFPYRITEPQEERAWNAVCVQDISALSAVVAAITATFCGWRRIGLLVFLIVLLGFLLTVGTILIHSRIPSHPPQFSN